MELEQEPVTTSHVDVIIELSGSMEHNEEAKGDYAEEKEPHTEQEDPQPTESVTPSDVTGSMLGVITEEESPKEQYKAINPS